MGKICIVGAELGNKGAAALQISGAKLNAQTGPHSTVAGFGDVAKPRRKTRAIIPGLIP
jgi:hypothetical protein